MQAVVGVVEQASEVLFFQCSKLPGEGQYALAQVDIVAVRGERDKRLEGGFQIALSQQGAEILVCCSHGVGGL